MKTLCFAYARFAFLFLFISLSISISPNSGYAIPADIELLQKLVQELQSQMATYQTHMEKQEKMIELQGNEIADLKNRLEAIPTNGAPFQEGEKFKQGVLGVINELRLSEREQTKSEDRLTTLYDDGFYLKGKDDTLKIGGWWQGDFNAYDRGNEGNTRFRNRRVRLDMRGVLEDVFEYRLYTQYAGASANLQEAWLMYKYFPNARLKFGQFKVPFSLESQYSIRWLDFMERSIGVTNLQPAEDLGIMVYGSPFGERFEYAAGIFNGRARTLDDNNDNFDVAGRVVLAPFKKFEQALLRDFYLGGSVTIGSSQETLAGSTFTTAGGTPFLTFSPGTRHTDNRTRLGAELQWIYGPGDIKAEYVAARFNDVERSGNIKNDLMANSWYVSTSYLLTGERKLRNKPIQPKHNFSLKDRTWGAWEVGLRFEQFLIDSSPFDTGFVTGTDQVDALTGALNWWPNKHIRFMFDYVFNDFSDSIRIGGKSKGSENLFLSRVQYNF